MQRRLCAGLAALTLLAATAAQADVGRAHPANPAGEPARSSVASEQDARRIEIERFKAAPISLYDALSLARQSHDGSRVVDAGFDGEGGVATYKVTIKTGNGLWLDVIDAHTGKTIKSEPLSSLIDLDRSDRDLLVRLRAVRQELSDAIVVAERNAGGRAISAGLMLDQGRLQFVIVCVSGNDLKQVMLEPPATVSRVKRSSN